MTARESGNDKIPLSAAQVTAVTAKARTVPDSSGATLPNSCFRLFHGSETAESAEEDTATPTAKKIASVFRKGLSLAGEFSKPAKKPLAIK